MLDNGNKSDQKNLVVIKEEPARDMIENLDLSNPVDINMTIKKF